jgi:hypothetical protein
MTPGPDAPGFGPWRSDRWAWLLAASALVGAALRIWHLGEWSFWADEMFTITSSGEGFTWSDHRPLAFAMNHYLTIPWLGMTELALRLFPAIAGIVAVPLLGWCTARRYGRAAGALSALLSAVAVLLIYWSQFGRYYAQAFLCATAFVFGAQFAVTGRSWRWGAVAALAFLVGWQFVPTIALSAGGVGLWLAWNWRELLTPGVRATLRRYRLPIGAAVLAGAAAAAVMVLRLFDYMLEITALSKPYYTLPGIAVTTLLGVGLPVAGLMAGGLWACWRDERLDPLDRTFVPLVSVGCTAAFVAAYFAIPLVSPWHFISLLPTFYAAAGIALAQLWRGGARGPAPAVATAAVLAAGVPELASYHVDGSRYDYRGATTALAELHRADPGPVYGYGAALIRFLQPGLAPEEFKPEGERLAWLEDSARARTTWVLLPEGRRGPAFPESLPGMRQLREHCRAERRIGRERFAYHQYTVVLYRCPAADTARLPRVAGAGAP